MTVTMVPIEGSTNVQKVGYDHLLQELHIEFAGGTVYVFSDVPPVVHSSLMGAKSKGSYFHANVKGAYQHRKLETPKEAATTE